MSKIITTSITIIYVATLCISLAACNIREPAELGSNIVLSDDLDSRMFSLDGIIYTLPVSFTELEGNGWSPYDPDSLFASNILEPGDSAYWGLVNVIQDILVVFKNLSEEVLPISECYIISVIVLVREGNPVQFNAELVLPGNIMIGSTLEDVIAAYGDTATWVANFEETSTFRITYTTDYLSLNVSLDTEKNMVIFMDLRYIGWP